MGNQALSILPALIGLAFTVCATALLVNVRHRYSVLESLFQQGPPVALFDRDLRVRRVNPAFARLFGYAAEEARGLAISELISANGQGSGFDGSAAALSRGEALQSEAELRRKDGSRFTAFASYVPLRGVNGASGVLAAYREIEPGLSANCIAKRVLEAQEAERRHLARELHDEIGQSLTGLRMLLRDGDGLAAGHRADRLEEARSVLDDLISRVRVLSFDLRPVDLDLLGLTPALASLFGRFTAQTGILVSFKHEGIEGRLSSCVETGAFRIVQEALTNVARHAAVASVHVRLWRESERLYLRIEDRGAGFDPPAVMQTPKSSGLSGMQERASLLNGRMIVDSSPGCGTTIHVELPMVNERQHV